MFEVERERGCKNRSNQGRGGVGTPPESIEIIARVASQAATTTRKRRNRTILPVRPAQGCRESLGEAGDLGEWGEGVSRGVTSRASRGRAAADARRSGINESAIAQDRGRRSRTSG